MTNQEFQLQRLRKILKYSDSEKEKEAARKSIYNIITKGGKTQCQA